MTPQEEWLECAASAHRRIVAAICQAEAGQHAAALSTLQALEQEQGEHLDLIAQLLIVRLQGKWSAALGDYQQAYAHCRRQQELFELCIHAESSALPASQLQPQADAAVGNIGFLTAREHQVFTLVAQGLSSKEIARRFGISPRTVEIHRARVLHKLGVSSLAELTRLHDQLAGIGRRA